MEDSGQMHVMTRVVVGDVCVRVCVCVCACGTYVREREWERKIEREGVCV